MFDLHVVVKALTDNNSKSTVHMCRCYDEYICCAIEFSFLEIWDSLYDLVDIHVHALNWYSRPFVCQEK